MGPPGRPEDHVAGHVLTPFSRDSRVRWHAEGTMAVDIRTIEVSDHVRAKINGKHGLSELDVMEACEMPLAAAWDADPERGDRLLIRGRTSSGRIIRIVLYPIDVTSGTWRLGTAF